MVKTKFHLGLKLWSTNHYWYDEAARLCKEKVFDYIELMYIPKEEEEIEKLSKVKVIIHAPTFMQGVHFSDGNVGKNISSFRQTAEIAEKLNAEAIIIHPDFGTEQSFISFLQEIKPFYDHKKIFIENMPKIGIRGETAIGFTPQQIKRYMEVGNYGFCLDFAHAVKAAASLKEDYKKTIEEFLELKPQIAHVSGTDTLSEIDEHLDLDKGNLDLQFLKTSLIQHEIKFVTLETPKGNELRADVKNASLLKSLLFRS